MVGLKPDFSQQRRFDFALIAYGAGPESSCKLSFDEELGVKDSGGCVERGGRNSWVNKIGTGNSMSEEYESLLPGV